jgi:hypothetical protein
MDGKTDLINNNLLNAQKLTALELHQDLNNYKNVPSSSPHKKKLQKTPKLAHHGLRTLQQPQMRDSEQ